MAYLVSQGLYYSEYSMGSPVTSRQNMCSHLMTPNRSVTAFSFFSDRLPFLTNFVMGTSYDHGGIITSYIPP